MPLERGYADLIAWKKAIDLCEPVYRLARELPPDERFELSAQLRRAVVSVAANIAEGAVRRGSREFARFLGIAMGSLAEVDTLLAVAAKVSILPASRVDTVRAQVSEERRILCGLSETIRRRIRSQGGDSPSATPLPVPTPRP
ncbi:MAG: four helix bundle protein [Planctomycetia bacterium]|nr:four helix bundle protein [Planctomycetia bacterium]